MSFASKRHTKRPAPDVQKRTEEEDNAYEGKSIEVHPDNDVQAAREIIQRSTEKDDVNVQLKLTVGKPNDKYEQEADATAESAMSKPDSFVQKKSTGNGIQRKDEESLQTAKIDEIQTTSAPEVNKPSAPSQGEFLQAVAMQDNEDESTDSEKDTVSKKSFVQLMEEETRVSKKEFAENSHVESKVEGPSFLQMMINEKDVDESEESSKEPIQKSAFLQRVAEDDIQAKQEGKADPATISAPLKASKGGGDPLPDETRTEMESRFGDRDFSNVRIHTDSRSAEMNQNLNSKAFANGSDVYFNKGQFDTGSTDGKKLLAHELTHTIQQGGVGDKVQRSVTDEFTHDEDKKSAEKNTDDLLADEMGDDVSIDQPPKVDSDEKKPDESEKETDRADEVAGSVSPDKDRFAESIPNAKKGAETVEQDASKKPDVEGGETEKPKEGKKKTLSAKEQARLTTMEAFDKAGNVKLPKKPKTINPPKLSPPKDAQGKPMLLGADRLIMYAVYLKRAELLRQKGYNLRLQAIEEMVRAHQLFGNIHLILESIYENDEAMVKQRAASESRKELITSTKTFQEVAEKRTSKASKEAPDLLTKSTELAKDVVPIADEAKVKEQEQNAQTDSNDDPDFKKKNKESSSTMSDVKDDTTSLGENAASMQSDSETITKQLPTALEDNNASQTSIVNTEKMIGEVDAKLDEIDSINSEATATFLGYISEPIAHLEEAERIDTEGENLIKKSEKLEKGADEMHTSYIKGMEQIPAEENQPSEQGTPVIQKQESDTEPLNDEPTERELQIMEVEAAHDADQEKWEIDLMKADDDHNVAERALFGLSTLGKSALEDVVNVPWADIPNMLKEDAEMAINDPGRYFMGMAEAVGTFFLAPDRMMPGEPAVRYGVRTLAQWSTGLALLLGGVAALCGAALALIAILTFFFFPVVAPSWPFIPWITTTMSITGGWSIFFAEVALLLRFAIILNDVIMMSFASSAEEQKQWAAMMEDNINGIWAPLLIFAPTKFMQKFGKRKPKKSKDQKDAPEAESNTPEVEGKVTENKNSTKTETTDGIDSNAQANQKDVIDQADVDVTKVNEDINSSRTDRDAGAIENTPEGEMVNSDEVNRIESQEKGGNKTEKKIEKDLKKVEQELKKEQSTNKQDVTDDVDVDPVADQKKDVSDKVETTNDAPEKIDDPKKDVDGTNEVPESKTVETTNNTSKNDELINTSGTVTKKSDGTFKLNRKRIGNFDKISGDPEAVVLADAQREALAAEKVASRRNIEKVYFGVEADKFLNKGTTGQNLSVDVAGVTKKGKFILSEAKGKNIKHGLDQLEQSAKSLGFENVIRYELVIPETIQVGYKVINGELYQLTLSGKYIKTKINGKPIFVTKTTTL